MSKADQWAETGVGAVVLAAATGFLIYALANADGFGHSGGYDVTAKFGQVGALASGADVRLAGVKIGAVSKITLDPKSFLAVADLNLDKGIKLPEDSTAKITSDSLLGGQHISIEPGGSLENIKPGGAIINTQGAVDIFSIVGQALRPHPAGPTPASDDSATTPAAPTSTPAPAPSGG